MSADMLDLEAVVDAVLVYTEAVLDKIEAKGSDALTPSEVFSIFDQCGAEVIELVAVHRPHDDVLMAWLSRGGRRAGWFS